MHEEVKKRFDEMVVSFDELRRVVNNYENGAQRAMDQLARDNERLVKTADDYAVKVSEFEEDNKQKGFQIGNLSDQISALTDRLKLEVAKSNNLESELDTVTAVWQDEQDGNERDRQEAAAKLDKLNDQLREERKSHAEASVKATDMQALYDEARARVRDLEGQLDGLRSGPLHEHKRFMETLQDIVSKHATLDDAKNAAHDILHNFDYKA